MCNLSYYCKGEFHKCIIYIDAGMMLCGLFWMCSCLAKSSCCDRSSHGSSSGPGDGVSSLPSRPSVASELTTLDGAGPSGQSGLNVGNLLGSLEAFPMENWSNQREEERAPGEEVPQLEEPKKVSDL